MKRELLDRLLKTRAEKRAVALVTDMATGDQCLVGPGSCDGDLALDAASLDETRQALMQDRSGRLPGKDSLFVASFNPPLRLFVVGAVHIAQSLIPMARLAGYEVILIDPRRAWSSEERFPDMTLSTDWPDEALRAAQLEARSAVVALTHDPKLDDPALQVALASPAFYIGALGSKRTHAGRLERLAAHGLDQASLARIHGPIGLDLGGRSPQEIAIAILAQMTQVRHQSPASDGKAAA